MNNKACVAILLMLAGIAAVLAIGVILDTGGHIPWGWGKAFVLLIAALFGLLTVDYIRPKLSMLFAAACVLFLFTGCAALPMPLQPRNEQFNSDVAEGAFIVLASVDTLQTMHLKPGTKCGFEADPFARAIYGSREPSKNRVLLTNIALITAHTMVASWLDDKVAAENAKMEAGEDNNLGPWYFSRVAFHTISLVWETTAVINNSRHGCAL